MLFVVEEESDPKRFSIHRLAHYCLDLGELFEQGLAQGEHIGMRKGEARVLLTLMRLKFGTVSQAVEARIDQADADTLLRWSGRVLSAGSIEDVVGNDG